MTIFSPQLYNIMNTWVSDVDRPSVFPFHEPHEAINLEHTQTLMFGTTAEEENTENQKHLFK